ncbi:MAG: MFS transporter [Pseudomonadota bacterium]
MSDNEVTSTARKALGILFLVSFFNYMDRYVLFVLMPSIKSDMGLSDTQLGLLVPVFTISYVILGLPFARIADKFNRKNVITVALTIWSAMTAVCGLAQNFVQLLLARVMVGVGEAGASPPSHSLISDYFPVSSRARAIAIFSLGAPVGIIVSSLLASWIAQEYSWRIAFLCLGLPGLLLAFAVYFWLKEPARGQSEQASRAKQADESHSFVEVLKNLLSSPAYVHLCVGTGIYTVLWQGVAGWVPSFFVRSFDMSLVQAGFWFAISIGVSQLIGIYLGGVLADRLVKKDTRWYSWLPAIAIFVTTPLYLLVFRSFNPAIAITALFAAFMISVFQGPASFTAVQSLAHLRMRAVACAMFLLITNLIGGTLGTFLTGLLSDFFEPTYGADSLQQALLIISLVFGFWASLHYWLSSRTIREELQQN